MFLFVRAKPFLVREQIQKQLFLNYKFIFNECMQRDLRIFILNLKIFCRFIHQIYQITLEKNQRTGRIYFT